MIGGGRGVSEGEVTPLSDREPELLRDCGLR